MYATLHHKVAVVIGSASGIGAATAMRLAAAGADVLLADVNEAGADAQARLIRDQGFSAAAIGCDVRDESQVAAALDAAVERWGGLDILHNNAAATMLVRADGMVAEADAEHWDLTFEVNVRGQMFGCKHAIRHMAARGGGSIINTSSANGIVGDLFSSAYSASKAAVIQLTRTVATQYGRQGIRCNAVIPGLIQVTRDPAAGMDPTRRQRMTTHQVLPMSAGPEEVANAVAFLAGDEARFVTGHALVVDGGLTIHMPTYRENVEAS